MGISNVDNEKIVELSSEAQINETCEQEADIEVLESTFDVYVSDDDSSIELSDSEFDLDGENPSIIEELKIDNPEEPEQSVISAVDDDTRPVRNDIESAIAETNNDEANMNFSQRVSSGDDQGEQIDTYTKELANEVIAEERKLQSSEKQDDQVKKTTMSQKANLSNKLKKKKIPKLLIKPIRKDEELQTQDNVAEECSALVKEMVTSTVFKLDTEVIEPKMPPIIVKIPKLSISPKKSSKKDNIKSPTKNCIKKLNFSFTKQPTVSIKNLKIIPPVPPEVTEAILELANAEEIVPDAPSKEEKKSSPLKIPPIKPFSTKLKLQTPPPLCVIKNKKKAKSPEKTTESPVEQREEEKESIVTVLKMSEIVSMKQKEDDLDRRNDLEKMLELENKLKIEDRKRIKEEKVQKKSGKSSSRRTLPR